MVEGRAVNSPLEHQIVVGASWQKQRNYYSGNSFYGPSRRRLLYEPNAQRLLQRRRLRQPGHGPQRGHHPEGRLRQRHRRSPGALVGAGRPALHAIPPEQLRHGHRRHRFRLRQEAAHAHRGADVQARPATMAYASYVEALEPGSVVGILYANRGEVLSPIKSKQYEVGIKTERGDWPPAPPCSASSAAPVARGGGVGAGRRVGLAAFPGAGRVHAPRLSTGTVGGSLMLLDTEYREGGDNIGNRVVGGRNARSRPRRSSNRVPYVPGQQTARRRRVHRQGARARRQQRRRGGEG